jgi:hypothetical protein
MLMNFSNSNIPSFVNETYTTACYDGDVSLFLYRTNGEISPILDWDTHNDIPKYDDVVILRVIHNDDPLCTKNLTNALASARHYNIRLVLPKRHYCPSIRENM